MPGNYEIGIDREHKMLLVTLRGFLSIDDIPSYLTTKNRALHELNCGRNQHVTLCDVSTCDIQSQDVMQKFKESIADPRYASKRIAFVTGSTLARLQVRRILTREGASCFDTPTEARAWLLREDA